MNMEPNMEYGNGLVMCEYMQHVNLLFSRLNVQSLRLNVFDNQCCDWPDIWIVDNHSIRLRSFERFEILLIEPKE